MSPKKHQKLSTSILLRWPGAGGADRPAEAGRAGGALHCQESAISTFANVPILSISMRLSFQCWSCISFQMSALSEGELDRVGGSHRWARERGKGRPVLPPGGPGRHLPSGGREHPLLPSLPTAGHKGWADPVQVNLTFQEEKCSADHFWIYLIFSTLQV